MSPSIRVRDLLLIDRDGNVVEGTWPFNPVAFVIHSQIHAARPDVISVAHAHSIHGKALSSLRRPLRPLTQDACAFYDDHSVFDDYSGAASDLEGHRIATALGHHKAVILSNHGLLTVGETVDAAAWWFITMERTCQAQLLAEAVGNPVDIDPDIAKLTGSQVGVHRSGWRSFQPLYDWIVDQQPDLLEE